MLKVRCGAKLSVSYLLEQKLLVPLGSAVFASWHLRPGVFLGLLYSTIAAVKPVQARIVQLCTFALNEAWICIFISVN